MSEVADSNITHSKRDRASLAAVRPAPAGAEKVIKQAEDRALTLFKQASKRIPAYKDFLQKNSVNASKIVGIEDFQQIPVIDKKSYLRQYPLSDMCWDGKLSPNYILSSSSGSTGEPFLWPRGLEQEIEGKNNFDTIFNGIFQLQNKKVLYINCFAMGTWISGPFVLACAEQLSLQGNQIITITPGIDKAVTYSLFKNLAKYFDVIVLSGYPPYVKDLLDDGPQNDITWRDHEIKFLFAAEGFSEKWRDYIHSTVGAKDPYHSSINIYGSADAAILGHETPLSIAIRRKVVECRAEVEFFGSTRLPTLVQYDPRLKFFEQVDGNLLFTTRSGLPLIRYSIGDQGDIWSYAQMMAKLDRLGAGESIAQEYTNWDFPFVSVFGRSDLTVSLYGLLIYPEHIKYGLENSHLSGLLSGKFVMSIEQDDQSNPYLLIKAELTVQTQESDALISEVTEAIVNGLHHANSEYTKLYQQMGQRVRPRIELVAQGDQEYFKQGTKQRWVRK